MNLLTWRRETSDLLSGVSKRARSHVRGAAMQVDMGIWLNLQSTEIKDGTPRQTD
jgi:hypothetical protein